MFYWVMLYKMLYRLTSESFKKREMVAENKYCQRGCLGGVMVRLDMPRIMKTGKTQKCA